MLSWLKDNGPVIGALAGALLALVAVLQLLVVGPINRGFGDLRSEMNGRFEAVDRRFDDLRSDMTGRFDDLRSEMTGRFDDLRSEMNGRFEAVDRRFDDLRTEMNGRFEAVEQRLDAVDLRLGRLEDSVSELRALSDRVSRNEGQIRIIRQQLQTVDAPGP